MLSIILSKHTDLTFFTRDTICAGIIPSLVILTNEDFFKCIVDYQKIKTEYPNTNVLCVRENCNVYAISALVYSELVNIVDTQCTPKQLYKIIKTLGNQNKVYFYSRRRSNILNSYFGKPPIDGLSFKDIAFLTGMVRLYKREVLQRFYNIDKIHAVESIIRITRLFGLRESEFKTPAMMLKYGGLTLEPKIPIRHYVNNPKTTDYYIIPRLTEPNV